MSTRAPLAKQDEFYNSRTAAQVIAYFAIRQGGRVIDILKAVQLTHSPTGKV